MHIERRINGFKYRDQFTSFIYPINLFLKTILFTIPNSCLLSGYREGEERSIVQSIWKCARCSTAPGGGGDLNVIVMNAVSEVRMTRESIQ